MNTPGHQLDQIYFVTLYLPGFFSFVLVIALAVLRKRFLVIPHWIAFALFTAGLLIIGGALPLWRALFPEPCLYYPFKPLSPCWMEPSAAFQMGLFGGVVGALMALLALKVSRVVARNTRVSSNRKV
jgi:hypothetical protein